MSQNGLTCLAQAAALAFIEKLARTGVHPVLANFIRFASRAHYSNRRSPKSLGLWCLHVVLPDETKFHEGNIEALVKR
jgi:hypothetical protein